MNQELSTSGVPKDRNILKVGILVSLLMILGALLYVVAFDFGLMRRDAQDFSNRVVDIECPHCGTEYEIDSSLLGNTDTCDECGKKFVFRRDSNPRDRNGVEEATEARVVAIFQALSRNRPDFESIRTVIEAILENPPESALIRDSAASLMSILSPFFRARELKQTSMESLRRVKTELQEEEKLLKVLRTKVENIEGRIIQCVNPTKYVFVKTEVSRPMRWAFVTKEIACVLYTLETEYSSTGHFSLHAMHIGKERGTNLQGFPMTWEAYREVPRYSERLSQAEKKMERLKSVLGKAESTLSGAMSSINNAEFIGRIRDRARDEACTLLGRIAQEFGKVEFRSKRDDQGIAKFAQGVRSEWQRVLEPDGRKFPDRLSALADFDQRWGWAAGCLSTLLPDTPSREKIQTEREKILASWEEAAFRQACRIAEDAQEDIEVRIRAIEEYTRPTQPYAPGRHEEEALVRLAKLKAEEDDAAWQEARSKARNASLAFKIRTGALKQYLERSQGSLKGRHQNEARQLLEEIMAQIEETARKEAEKRKASLLARAKEALSSGDIDQAERLLKELLRSSPGDRKANEGLREADDARVEMQYWAAMEEGWEAEGRKDWKAAIAAYERALNVKPGNYKALGAIEKVKMHLGSLPPGFENAFLIPTGDTDQHGNPVVRRNGSKTDPATRLPFEIWLKNPRMEFVLIPAGEFMMGSPDPEPSRNANEGPVHRVRITKPFYFAKYEVTQAQWRAVMGGNPSHFKNTGDSSPVETVSWYDCKKFCRKTGLSLPTEAQWEYACRAGTRTPFHFGATITPDQVNYDGRYPYGGAAKGLYRQTTVKAGSFPSNAWGLYDMHGNVWEWCEDVYDSGFYGKTIATGSDPVCTSGSSRRVGRGGCWSSCARYCRSADRGRSDPADCDYSLGFRPAMSIPSR